MFERLCFTLLACAPLAFADGDGIFVSHHAAADFALAADPEAASWKGVPGIFMENGPKGETHLEHRTEVRSRWTADNVYFLFVCPYQELHLKPNPTVTSETNKLWDWDVAEVFVGSDFQHIRRYKEFEMSPQGEWVDLDIDRDSPLPEGGWLWNSGFEAKARIDRAKKIWYGEMRIPLKTIDFSRGVNVTLGLPFVRTSPDHGTAFDIAGKGLANPSSLIAATRLAARLSG